MNPLHISADDILNMEHRFRVNFINGLSGYKSANLVGTVDSQGATNLAIVSSVVHLGADPALMGLVTRPRSVARHTIENLAQTGVYTINHVVDAIVPQAHQTSARYPREESEFEHTGLTPAWVVGFAAPKVAESTLSVGLRLREIKHLDINDTDFVIGEVQWVELDGRALGEDGFIDLVTLGTACVSGLDCYHSAPPRVGRFHYAKPASKPTRR